MKLLRRMILIDTLQVFLVALIFFVLILQMVDLFSNLWRYLNQDVPLGMILRIQLYYLPKCISYAVPIALLFSVAYTLGQLYANNELIALLGSGISLRYAILPILGLGLLLGVGLFRFEDRVVIPTFANKNALMNAALDERVSLSNSNVTIRGSESGILYSAEYYNDGNQTLSNLSVLILSEEGEFEGRIDAKWAEYVDGKWIFHDARIFRRVGDQILQERQSSYRDERLNDDPASFQRRQKDVEELSLDEARIYINELERSGQDSRLARTDYYSRIAFVFTPLIVALISSAVGSRFKKNILLMSLLMSLCVSVIFYVLQMITGIFANIGLLSPFAGAFFPVIFFLGIGIAMLQFVRT